MKLMFMFCSNCLDMATNSRNWLVDHKKCQCIFLEEMEKPMILNRKTYWSNGLITYREMEVQDETLFKAEQQRRVTNGPGIDSVEFFDFRGRRYYQFDKPKSLNAHTMQVFEVQCEAAKMERNMFEAMMVHGTKEELQRYCLENGMAMPSENRIKLAKANDHLVQDIRSIEQMRRSLKNEY